MEGRPLSVFADSHPSRGAAETRAWAGRSRNGKRAGARVCPFSAAGHTQQRSAPPMPVASVKVIRYCWKPGKEGARFGPQVAYAAAWP